MERLKKKKKRKRKEKEILELIPQTQDFPSMRMFCEKTPSLIHYF